MHGQLKKSKHNKFGWFCFRQQWYKLHNWLGDAKGHNRIYGLYSSGRWSALFVRRRISNCREVWQIILISRLTFKKLSLRLPLLSLSFRLNYKGDLKTTPTLVTGDGDGTVNARSLKACEQWSGTKAQAEKTIHSIEIPGVDHMGILSDKRVVEYVLEVLVQNKTYDKHESELYDVRLLNNLVDW